MDTQIFSYEALGTQWKVTLWERGEQESARIQDDIIRMSREFEQPHSRFVKTSYVWSLAGRTGISEISQDFYEMLLLYKKLYAPSEKKFTPLIGSVLRDFGYDEEYSFVQRATPVSPPDFERAVQIINDHAIDIREPVFFDVGGLGKGYLVDKISAYLQSHGCTRFLVDGSGDLFYKGNSEEIRIGLEHPDDHKKVIGVATLKNGALCGSGCRQRSWGEYCHIIDPHSFRSPKNILATWVVAETAAVADALATCLFLADQKNFQKDFSFEYCMIDSDYRIQKSACFPAELF